MKLFNSYLLSFLLLSMGGFVACDLENPDLGIPVEEVITLTTSQNTLLANEEHSMTITATLGAASNANLQLTFTTSNGTFLENGEDNYSVAASGKIATATLVSSDEIDEAVVVVAEVTALDDPSLVFKATQTLAFTTAFPDDVLLTSNQNVIDKTGFNEAILSAKLFRNIGKPSQGIKVNFKAIPLDSATVSLIAFDFTDMEGIARTAVKSSNLKVGRVAIVAEVPNQEGMIIRDTFELNIID